MLSKEKLLEMIASDKSSDRYDAIEGMRISQESSPEIVTALDKATHDPDPEIARRASQALEAEVHHKMAVTMGLVQSSTPQPASGEVILSAQKIASSINLDFVSDQLREFGWKDNPLAFKVLKFDLVVSRRFGLDPWLVMVKLVPVLDIYTLNRLQSNFEFAFAKMKSNLLYRNFYLYIVSQKVTQQAIHALRMDHYNFQRFSQKKSGIRKLMVFDITSRQGYGPYPAVQPFEKEAPFDLRPIFIQATTSDGLAYPLHPVQDEVAALIDSLKPTSALKLIEQSHRQDLGIYKVQALRELGRIREEEELLESILPGLQGDDLARALRFKAQNIMSKGQIDEGIWLLEKAATEASDARLRAAVIATKGTGYAAKGCINLAHSAITQALLLAPDEPRVSFAQAHLLLMMDQRLEARAVLERMNGESEGWVNSYIDFDLANIAMLLGEFDEAARRAKSALAYSSEIIFPLSTLIEQALLKGNFDETDRLLKELEIRSPAADVLPLMREEIERQQKRLVGLTVVSGTHIDKSPLASGAPVKTRSQAEEQGEVRHRRLKSFPSLVQRRDYCGPCTIELVLRYWKGGLDLTNNDIARRVKMPQSGTPIHRMTGFFRLIGFDTIRCVAPAEKLKPLIDAGFPVIVEEQAAGQGHVTVVIGYDDEAGTIELQDPMTHHVISIPVPELDRLRHTLYNSALVAFPPSDENQETLARLGIFKDEVLTLIDQASLASEMGNLSKVTELMDLATRIRPEHGLAWEFLLQALLHQWWSVSDSSRSAIVDGTQGEGPSTSIVQGFRSAFYSALGRARQAHPTTEFCFIFEGRAAVVDRNLPQALEAFQKALEIQPANPETLADIAECQFELDHVEQALESAQKAVRLVPSSVTANVWLGRCLADLTKPHAEYYARVGLDLAPTWWLSHLVMADVLMNASQDRELPENAFPASLLPEQEAWKEINYVLAADPHQLYALLLRAIIMMRHSDFTSARSVLQKALESAQAYPADPIIIHRLKLWLCLSYYNQGMFDEARKQVLEMLEKEPGDPWALQHLAAVEFNQLKRLRQEAITKGEPEPDIQPAIDRYLSAIQANRGDPYVVATFVSFLMQVGKDDEAIKILKSLCEQYPSQPNLLFHYAMVLSRAEKKEPVAGVLLDALSKENGIHNTDELSDAYNAIIFELGPQKGEEAILKISLPPGQTTLQRDRSLGLILASYPKEKGDRARQLLEKVLADDPQDAEVIFWMGLNLALTEEEHEQLLRQALTIAPHWGYARWSLIRYLLQKSRIEDALELSRGYEGESLSLLRQHIYCLNALGFFEEALPAADHLIGDVALYGERTSNDYAMKVDVYSYNGEHQKALETVQQARKLFPDDLAWHMSECIAYCNLEQADPARAAIDQGEARGLEMRLVNEGRYWIETFQGHWPGAMNIARQQEQVEWDTCEKDKDHPAGSLVLWSNRYLALLAHLSEPHEVENYLKVIYQDNRLWENIPIILGHVRCNQLALKYSEKILKEPTVWENARYYALLGRALASRNLDDPNAQAYFAEIQYMFPRATGAYETLACYAALDGNLDLAASLAEQAIANLRSSPSAWAVRGLVHFLSGWRKAALDTLNRGWSRFPWDRFTDFPLWWLYFSLQGNQLKAQQWKQKALDQAQSSFDRRLIEIIQSRLE